MAHEFHSSTWTDDSSASHDSRRHETFSSLNASEPPSAIEPHTSTSHYAMLPAPYDPGYPPHRPETCLHPTDPYRYSTDPYCCDPYHFASHPNPTSLLSSTSGFFSMPINSSTLDSNDRRLYHGSGFETAHPELSAAPATRTAHQSFDTSYSGDTTLFDEGAGQDLTMVDGVSFHAMNIEGLESQYPALFENVGESLKNLPPSYFAAPPELQLSDPDGVQLRHVDGHFDSLGDDGASTVNSSALALVDSPQTSMPASPVNKRRRAKIPRLSHVATTPKAATSSLSLMSVNSDPEGSIGSSRAPPGARSQITPTTRKRKQRGAPRDTVAFTNAMAAYDSNEIHLLFQSHLAQNVLHDPATLTDTSLSVGNHPFLHQHDVRVTRIALSRIQHRRAILPPASAAVDAMPRNSRNLAVINARKEHKSEHATVRAWADEVAPAEEDLVDAELVDGFIEQHGSLAELVMDPTRLRATIDGLSDSQVRLARALVRLSLDEKLARPSRAT